MNLKYISIQQAIAAQIQIIEDSGGLAGIKNQGLLESVLEHIQNDLYYPSFEGKLTHLVFSINKNHAFNDGNKRSSIALGSYFLLVNGFEYCIKKFTEDMENIAVYVADNIIDKDLLAQVIFSIINEDEYNESLQLELIEVMTQATTT